MGREENRDKVSAFPSVFSLPWHFIWVLITAQNPAFERTFALHVVFGVGKVALELFCEFISVLRSHPGVLGFPISSLAYHYHSYGRGDEQSSVQESLINSVRCSLSFGFLAADLMVVTWARTTEVGGRSNIRTLVWPLHIRTGPIVDCKTQCTLQLCRLCELLPMTRPLIPKGC